MTLHTKDGRPFCEVRDRSSGGPVLHIQPALYDVLRRVTEGHLACTVELHFSDQGLGGTHVRIDGEKLSRMASGADSKLQPCSAR